MAERRSLGQALTLSPEKLAFIQGGTSEPTGNAPPVQSPVPTIESSAVEVSDREDRNGHGIMPSEPDAVASKPAQRKRKDSIIVQSESQIPVSVWVPITTRLQHRTAIALRRAHLELRLRNASPDTQQEIIDQAVGHWLRANDFLD